MAAPVKLCKDCRWITRRDYDDTYSSAKCSHPLVVSEGENLVAGNGEASVYCSTERKLGEQCGEKGKLWEVKAQVVKRPAMPWGSIFLVAIATAAVVSALVAAFILNAVTH